MAIPAEDPVYPTASLATGAVHRAEPSRNSSTDAAPKKIVRILPKPTLSPLQIPASMSEHLEPLPEPPPRDSGFAAWSVLFAATTVSAFPCGFYLSYGVFQAYYKVTYSNSANSAWIGALSSGMPFLLAPLMVYICTHTAWSRIHFVWISWLLGIVALVGAAFSLNINSLIITQGLLFGLSIVVGDNPLLLIVNTWFRKHRGLAYGIIFGICDLFGVVWSFLGEHLLHHLGQRKTFLIFAAILFAVPGPCLLLLKERGSTNILHRSTLSATPKSAHHSRSNSGASGRELIDDTLLSPIGGNFELVRRDTPPTKKRFYVRPLFYLFAAANLAQSLAFYLPLIYLPTYALQLPTSSTSNPETTSNKTGALALALINLAQILGEVLFGRLSDFLSVHVLAVTSSLLASLSTFLLWGFATTKPLLLAYGFVFGFSGAAFLGLWARMGMLFGERDAMMVYAVLGAGRGLGGVVCGPVSVALLGTDGEWDATIGKGQGQEGWANVVAGGRYKPLIVFVGVCMAVSAVLGMVGFVVDRAEEKRRERDGEELREEGEKKGRSQRLVRRLSSTSCRKGGGVVVAVSDRVGAEQRQDVGANQAEDDGGGGVIMAEKEDTRQQQQRQDDSNGLVQHHRDNATQTVLNSILRDLKKPQPSRSFA